MNKLSLQCLALAFGVLAATVGVGCTSGDGVSSTEGTTTGSGGGETTGSGGGTTGSGGGGTTASGGSGGATTTTSPFEGCTKGELEVDQETGMPLSGPGVDPDSGALKAGSYVIASTYLAFKPETSPQVQELGSAVVESLFSMKGFVAATTSSSNSCAALRTISVWETEEDMFEFVISPAHSKAMLAISDISRGTSNTMTWEGSEAAVTWEEAAKQLAADPTADL